MDSFYSRSELEHIGKEFVRQEIEYIPAKLRLVRYVRNIYKCKKCNQLHKNIMAKDDNMNLIIELSKNI